MDTRKFDVVVIGAGSAGLAAHAAALRVTASVLLIEAGVGGTTCARAGCMPSKLLIAAAHACREVAGAGTFGINVTGVSVDGAAVMRRVQALRDEFVAGVLRDVAEIPSGQRLQGLAHFEDMRTLRVNGERIEAGRVVIATGSLPQIPASFAELGDRLLTTDNVFDLPTLPASVAVIGGGTVGLELGQAFHALGVRTRLFHNGRTLGPKGDADMTALATRLFTEDLPCELGVQAAPTRHSPHEVELGWTGDDGVPRTEAFEYVLMAAGRKPSLASLNLAASGLELDEHGVPRFDPATMQCGDSTVFMAGDVDARWPILHEATADGRIAGDNAARYPQHRPHVRNVPLAIAFTSPQFASIGQRPDTLDAASTAVGRVSFVNQGRSRVMAANVGAGHVYGCTRTGRLLGAQLIGPAVEHLAHLLAWALQQGLTVDAVLKLPFYHPTVEEGLRTAMRELRDAIRKAADKTAPPTAQLLDCGPCP